jgi:cellobiose phosphorylase
MENFLGRSLCVVMVTMSCSYASIEKKQRKESPCHVVDRSVITPSPTLVRLVADHHHQEVARKLKALDVAEKALYFGITSGFSADMIDILIENIKKQTSDNALRCQIGRTAKELYKTQSPAVVALQAAINCGSASASGRYFFRKKLDAIKKAPLDTLPELVDEVKNNLQHWNKKFRR